MKCFAGILALLLLFAQAMPTAAITIQNAATGCSVPHRTVAAIIESVGDGDSSTEIPEAVPYRQPEGIQADPVTAEEIAATVEVMVACVNAGDTVGFLSVLSNGFLKTHFADMGFSEEELSGTGLTPMPEDEQLSLLETWDITELSDGRIVARFVFDQGESESPELNAVLTFVRVNEEWKIDEWQPVLAEETAPTWHVIRTGSYTGAVVPREEVGAYVGIINGSEIQGAWTPTDDDIAELERLLPVFLATEPNATSRMIENPEDYLRHYIGYVDQSKTLILVNVFCDRFDSWATEPVMVLDGGDCYFSVIYDPATGTFANLRVNGSA